MKADKTEISSVSRIVTINYGTSSFLVQAGTIVDRILIDAPTTITFKCGTTPGSDDVVTTEDVTDSTGYPIAKHCKVGTTLYFSGQAPDTKIYIIKDKLI
jgi:hypothetical protein